ncbi:GntR family transcriptional regulator [Streptomyces sp. CC208A]|uniref:GntR family transcriptional regulator n=1 Tax=Streptomyces sp. CC208A TaxID=3044573 RepID=UPI0024A92976|nr:GntR family transcriptional regulator [Streptomyces sp. CC208A]
MSGGPVLRVDTAGPIPPYEQIRAQLAALIASGSLADGERLPTVRQLAADLGLATGTVARAYRELEAASLVRTRRGAGTRVHRPPGTATPTATAPDRARLAALAQEFTAAARALGADDTTILSATQSALGRPH